MLVKAMQKHCHIIECKNSKGPSREAKDRSWQQVTDQYNFCRPQLTTQNLIYCWNNLKRATKQYLVDEKEHRSRTGGGENEFQKNDLFEEIIKMIGSHLEPLPDLNLPKVASTVRGLPGLMKYLTDTEQITDWRNWDGNKFKKSVSSPLHDQRIKIDDLQDESSQTNSNCCRETFGKKQKVASTSPNAQRLVVDDCSNEQFPESSMYTKEEEELLKKPISSTLHQQILKVDELEEKSSSTPTYVMIDSLDDDYMDIFDDNEPGIVHKGESIIGEKTPMDVSDNIETIPIGRDFGRDENSPFPTDEFPSSRNAPKSRGMKQNVLIPLQDINHSEHNGNIMVEQDVPIDIEYHKIGLEILKAKLKNRNLKNQIIHLRNQLLGVELKKQQVLLNALEEKYSANGDQ